MKEFIKILHLEDMDSDAELVAREISKGKIEVELKRVINKKQFVHALKKFDPDVILSDHSLPSFNSEEALEIVQSNNLHIPFILVTATVSEEYAVKIMKQGASDYILKDRMQRLPSAIKASVEKYETKAELSRQMLLQQKLAAEINIMAQEKVRNEIGIELHDNINQILAASKLYLDRALTEKKNPTDMLSKGQLYVVQAIEEIRKLSHFLVAPPIENISLVRLIQDLIDDMKLTTKLKINLVVSNYKEEMLSRDIKITIYRIIQEQVNNILKHSKAKTAFIKLCVFPGEVLLTVNDDGKGFDSSKTFLGIGLQNIKHRIEFYGGTVKILSAPNQGCTVEVNIPINQQIKEIEQECLN